MRKVDSAAMQQYAALHVQPFRPEAVPQLLKATVSAQPTAKERCYVHADSRAIR